VHIVQTVTKDSIDIQRGKKPIDCNRNISVPNAQKTAKQKREKNLRKLQIIKTT